MKKSIFIIGVCYFLYAEPSAFELQSGATKKDITTLQSSSKNLQTIATDVQARLNNVEQIQDGLKSLIEGQNPKIRQLNNDVNLLKNQLAVLNADIEIQKEQSVEQLETIDSLRVEILSQQDEIKKLQETLKSINEIAVKNNEMVLQQLDILSKALTRNEQVAQKHTDHSTGDLSSSETQDEDEELQKEHPILFKDAKAAMRIKDYAKAEKILNFLVNKEFKIAECYFMLGDIAYSKQEYQNAVSYYKKSSSLDENALYMPVLLWRTVWSFRYLKDHKNYERFADILVRLYPNSEQAQKILELREKNHKKGKNNEQS